MIYQHVLVKIFFLSALLFFLFSFNACRYYRQNKLFKTDKEIKKEPLKQKIDYVKENYIIQKDDYINIKVYTNNGERLIDPGSEIRQNSNGQQRQRGQNRQQIKYLVQKDGTVDLPMIGNVYLEGNTIAQADSLLANEYEKYYKDVFVKTRILNKRVILLGALGSEVIRLENENMHLIEILALAGGEAGRGNPKYYNIRLIRGNLNDPDVFKIDLTTIEGMKKAHLSIQPNDIIYVEPYRKAALEGLKDFNPVFGLVNSLFTLFVLLNQLSR